MELSDAELMSKYNLNGDNKWIKTFESFCEASCG